jgi:hypothetical protein
MQGHTLQVRLPNQILYLCVLFREIVSEKRTRKKSKKMQNGGMILSNEVLDQLQEIAEEADPEMAIRKLIQQLIESKLAYWHLVNKNFEEKHGLSFDEYESTKRSEWDGSDWSKKEAYHDWEAAIVSIEYYSNIKDKWASQNSKTNL